MPFEFLGSKDGHVRHDVRHVEKERVFLVTFDEGNGAFGEALGEEALIGIHLDDLLPVIEGERGHLFGEDGMVLGVVVRIRNA